MLKKIIAGVALGGALALSGVAVAPTAIGNWPDPMKAPVAIGNWPDPMSEPVDDTNTKPGKKG